MIRFFCIICIFFYSSLQGDVIAAYFDKEAASRSAINQRNTFSLKAIPPHLLTDLYYAFIPFEPTAKGWELVITDQDKAFFKQMKEMKQNSSSLNLFISFGGWEFNTPGNSTYQNFSKMASTKDSRAQFIQAALGFLKEWNFDGIDLDWEYPADPSRGGEKDDLENFISLLKEMKESFSSSYLITAAFAAAPQAPFKENPEKFFQWIASCSSYLDRVNIMSYDYSGPFDKLTGVNAPLNSVQTSIENYLSHGVPKDKLVLGIPLYGHIFAGVKDLSNDNFQPGKPFEKGAELKLSTKSPGLVSYFEIADLIAKKVFTFAPHPETNTAIGYSATRSEWISFDTPSTITLKGQLARKMGLKGIFFWSIDMDEYEWKPLFPNIEAGKEGFTGK